MLSEPTIASLRGIAQQALQESTQTAPFDDGRAAVRAIFENVLATAAEAQNALRLTHRIPFELLAASFGYLDFAERVVVSHVCRFWRSVALACPSLWTDIRVAVATDGSNAARVESTLRALLARTGALPIRLAQTRRRLPPDVSQNPVGILDLALILPHSAQLHTLSLDFIGDCIHGRTEVLANLPLQVRHLSLRFTQETFMATLCDHPSLMLRSLPMLTVLEICGAFLVARAPWPTMPALQHLTLRSAETVGITSLATAVFPACPALETLMVVTLRNFAIGADTKPPPALPALSSVVLRGNLTRVGFCRELIAALGCDRAPHIALQHIEGYYIPGPTEWTDCEFTPVELSFFQPDGFNYRGERHESPVARFADAAGRTRTLIIFAQPRSFVMDMPPVMRSVTALALDEVDFGPTGFTPRSTLSPALERLTLRLSDATDDYSRLFHRPDENGVCRLQERDQRWLCTKLRRVELMYVPGAARPVVTCGDLVQLLDRLSAPTTVALGLQNMALRDDDEQAGLRARVSYLEIRPEYEPLAVEREWPSWRIDEDRTLE